jgi:ferritin-like metal-binding protein YciE
MKGKETLIAWLNDAYAMEQALIPVLENHAEDAKDFPDVAAAESFEIASYRALIAAARALGDEETARVCEEILRDEERMAAWLTENLPRVVQETLHRQE